MAFSLVLDEAVGRASHIDVVDEDLLILDKVSNRKSRKWMYLLFHSILNAGCKAV